MARDYWHAHSDRDFEDQCRDPEVAEQPRVERSGRPASDATRFVDCDYCNGDGGWETYPTHSAFCNPYFATGWKPCLACDGTGEMEVLVAPIDQDALDYIGARR